MGSQASKQSLLIANPEPVTKKHFCIIGGGSSGLIVMKELTALGHQVTCFEKLPSIGGVYIRSYKNTILTTSSLLTAWSDYSDGLENQPKFWTAEEYLEYLNNFAKKFDLMKNINFRHAVELVRKDEETGKWMVTVRGGVACDNCERLGGPSSYADEPEAEPRTLAFDGVCICSGTNTFTSLPEFPGQDKFKGEIIHSEKYRTPEVFKGKRVLIVGSGESGSDITNEISMHADKCAIAIRGKHGHLIPRIQAHGRVTDLNTNRCRYSNPYAFGDSIGYVNQRAKLFFNNFAKRTDLTRVLEKIGELNLKNKTSAFSKFGCKNEGFVTAMVLRGAELHRDTFELKEDRAVFADGSEFVCDAIVACTGYRNSFPMFDQYHPEISYAGMNPRSNFKQSICIAHPGEIAFFGFARPAFGSIPPATEMQSRLFALAVNGELALPSKEEMAADACKDQKNWETRFGYDAKRVKGLVDFQVYCDGIAKVIDCMPPLRSLFFTNITIWTKIMFGPFTMHQYRLRGPHANPKRAQEVLKRQPLGDLLESTITASFLITAKVLSLLGFSKYTPNEF
eukprot:gene7866-10675_t